MEKGKIEVTDVYNGYEYINGYLIAVDCKPLDTDVCEVPHELTEADIYGAHERVMGYIDGMQDRMAE